MPEQPLSAVPHRPPAAAFADCVRTVTDVARHRHLDTPAFRSPPRLAEADRTLRRRPDGTAVVAVRLTDRPFAAVQGDVIEGIVASNGLDGLPADRFRRAAWVALEGRRPSQRPTGRPTVPMSVTPRSGTNAA